LLNDQKYFIFHQKSHKRANFSSTSTNPKQKMRNKIVKRITKLLNDKKYFLFPSKITGDGRDQPLFPFPTKMT